MGMRRAARVIPEYTQISYQLQCSGIIVNLYCAYGTKLQSDNTTHVEALEINHPNASHSHIPQKVSLQFLQIQYVFVLVGFLL